ncbi:MAG: aminotransferase class V-fold PLP-dependent enzyme, partial [Deltaproteobacteria bacterium]|nr:aminotransferase class V-fold PLP-dependent enzyme [Deltaproteobacteria bacterium]
ETIGFAEDGCTDITALEGALDSNTACVVVGYPNFFGVVEKLDAVVRRAHAWGALVVSVTHEPYALGVLEPPGHVGVDIAVGEGQPLAVPPSYGGPGVGLLGIRGDKEMIQQLPGRLVGQTVDRQGQRAFVLTLSTREQHIRREKATSNICTNHNLIALAMAIRTALLGKRGFVEVSRLCLAKAEYLKKRLLESKRFILPFSAPTFNEVTLRFLDGSAEDLIKEMASHGVLVGPPLSRWKRFQQGGHDSDFLLAVTERHSRAEIDRLVELLTSVE